MSVKGPALLRKQNEKKIISLLRKHKQTSRKDLAKLIGVSKNTVSLIVDQFIQEGIVQEAGVMEHQQVGRPKIMIELRPHVYKALGIIISNSHLQTMVTDYALNGIGECTRPLHSTDVDQVIAQLAELIHEAVQAHPEIVGIGIAVPGIVDPTNGMVYNATKLGWQEVSLISKLKQAVQLPDSIFLLIQNNVKMTALCASLSRELDQDPSFFYMRIGEGVSGAFFQEGKIWGGSSWTSGEIGHISVETAGPLCRCGQRGCLEQLVSLRSFQQWESSLGTELTVEIMNEQMTLYGQYVGRSLISIMHLLNPGLIVIDSPYHSFLAFKKACLAHLETYALSMPYLHTEIEFIEKPYAQSLGAAIAVIHHFEQ